ALCRSMIAPVIDSRTRSKSVRTKHNSRNITQADPMSDSPARHLSLQGASNFRDLGGYPTADGRTTRWRHVFRSNHLGQLTADDIEIVRALGVRSAFDFRGVEERTGGVCVVDEVTVHSLPIEPTVVASLRAE